MSVIVIGIPVLDGRPHYSMVDSLLAEQFLAAREGVHLLVEWEIGCSLIGDARNRLAKRFLATDAQAMVFVDADISWKAGALLSLVKSRKEVIGATYRPKQDEVRFHVHGAAKRSGKFYKVSGLPGGFIKIDRRAFKRMMAKSRTYLGPDGTATYDFFPMGFHRGRYYGEDYGFCRLWRESGGTVWLDPSIRLRHHDGMVSYEGDPLEWLRREA